MHPCVGAGQPSARALRPRAHGHRLWEGRDQCDPVLTAVSGSFTDEGDLEVKSVLGQELRSQILLARVGWGTVGIAGVIVGISLQYNFS